MKGESGQERIWKSDDILAYHRRQLSEPYRSTVHLARFIQSVIPAARGEALDVACGTGANMFHLSRLVPGYRWTGVDYDGERLFPLGRPRFAVAGFEPTLISGDMYNLTAVFPARTFDLVLSMQTLLCVPDYSRVAEQLLAVTGRWLIVSSLFTDFDLDARIEVVDYTREDGVREPQYYNVYSLRRFESFCRERGCEEFIARDFEIDVDLPKTTDGRGTYTRTLAGGQRLQFSGPLLMPWKFVAVRMAGR